MPDEEMTVAQKQQLRAALAASKRSDPVPPDRPEAALHQGLAWGGLAVAAVSVFLPAAYGPLGMSVALIDGTDGAVALGFAALCAVCIAMSKGLLVALCGAGFSVVALAKIIGVFNAKAKAAAELDEKLAGNPFRGMADLAVHSLKPGVGLFLMLAGGACLIAAYLYVRAQRR